MCLLVLAWRTHRRYRLVVAANRDEFHEREAAPLAKWPAPLEILAGRDLRAQGTWLALDRARRFGVVTNYRELQAPHPHAPSRGDLIPHYLATPSDSGAAGFLGALAPSAHEYAGFNLLLTDADSLWYGSNRTEAFARALAPGVYGLSNESLDTPWPKLQRVRAGFESLLHEPELHPEALFGLLADRTPAAGPLASTPLPLELEQALSAPFVRHPRYGTRCSSVLLQEQSGRVLLAERRFDSAGNNSGETEYRLNPGEWP